MTDTTLFEFVFHARLPKGHDESATIARKYIKKNNLDGKVFTIQNCGPEPARDYGCMQAKGEFLAPLDSDDIWEPEYVEKMVMVLLKYPDVGLMFSDFILFNNENEEIIRKSEKLRLFNKLKLKRIEEGFVLISDGLFAYLLQEQPVFPSAMIFRSSFYRFIGPFSCEINNRKALSVEWEFILRAAKQSSFIYCEYPLSKIRKHIGNISGITYCQVQGTIDVLEIVLKKYDLSENEYRVAVNQIAQRCFEVGYYYFGVSKYAEARKWLLRSLKNKLNFKTIILYSLVFLPTRLIGKIQLLKKQFVHF